MTNKTAEFNTNIGNFKIELFGDMAPLTVGNFIKLVEEGFYNVIQILNMILPGFFRWQMQALIQAVVSSS